MLCVPFFFLVPVGWAWTNNLGFNRPIFKIAVREIFISRCVIYALFHLSYHRHIQISGSLGTLGIEPRSKINAVISYVNLLFVPPTPCTLFCRPDVPISQGAFVSHFTKILNLNICCVRLSIHFVLSLELYSLYHYFHILSRYLLKS